MRACVRACVCVCLCVCVCVCVCVCASFPVGFVGGKWELIVLVPDHCLSFYFACSLVPQKKNPIGPFRRKKNGSNI